MRRQRRELSLPERRQAASAMCRQVMSMPEFVNCRRLACYFPHEGEIDPLAILTRSWRMKKQVYMPVLDRLSANRLRFAPYREGGALHTNRYGIVEPVQHFSHYVSAQELDLLLMPLVAFDAGGNRLGMGGGYYDRTLSYFCYRHCWFKPGIIGLAYDFQRVESLESMAWDIPLDAIVTDQAVYRSRTAA